MTYAVSLKLKPETYQRFQHIHQQLNAGEIESLSKRGYRSIIAKKININGQGIGMYRIKKTLKLNNAEIFIKPNSFNYKKLHKGLEYEGNEFIIKFNGQQNWFK